MKHYSPKRQKTSKIHTINTILTWGKYKGDMIREILGRDPMYLVWCRNEIDWFDVDAELGIILDEYEFESDRHPWDDGYFQEAEDAYS